MSIISVKETAVLTNKEKEVTILGLIDVFDKWYVFPEIGKETGQTLKKKLEKGDYDSISNPADFERTILEDVRNVTKDLHFYFQYDPTLAKQLQEEKNQAKDETSSEEDPWFRNLKYMNFSLEKVQRLAGNVGYLKLNEFAPVSEAGKAITNALQFLSNCYAIIFDVRYNGGGSSDLVQYIISYLVGPEPQELLTFYNRKEDTIQQVWSFPYVPGVKLFKKPVYILTSTRSASAAEDFAYTLKHLKRATIVGEKTRGAANNPDVYRLSDNFVVYLPMGRPINPFTKDNWEGKGVEPHVKISQEKALEKAHVLALEQLVASEKDTYTKKLLEFESEYIDANYNSRDIALENLKELQGEYGNTKIVLKNNQLYWEWTNLQLPMFSKDGEIFYFFLHEPARISFAMGEEVEMHMQWLSQSEPRVRKKSK